jgi:hypothetical protein
MKSTKGGLGGYEREPAYDLGGQLVGLRQSQLEETNQAMLWLEERGMRGRLPTEGRLTWDASWIC